jgi:hypothetical protein
MDTTNYPKNDYWKRSFQFKKNYLLYIKWIYLEHST